MRILVTGANGQLGMTFQAIAPEYPEHEFFFYTSKELDITNPKSVESAFQNCNPDVIINCAAYIAVDKAEDEPEKAFAVNAEGVKNIVYTCEKTDSALIHISTDYVFDGTKEEPYTEEDVPNPINVYGESKLAGEKHVLASELRAIIIRTSWVYSEFGNNFVKTMLRHGKERDELNVVCDQFGSPTYARDLSFTCMSLITQLNLWGQKPSVYHYSNDGLISWFDFANQIMTISGINCNIQKTSSQNYVTAAQRPINTALSKRRIQERFNVPIKDWKTSLSECFKSL